MIVGGYNTRTYKNLKKVALDSSIFSWIRTHIQRSAVSLIVAHSATLEVCVYHCLQEITKAIRVSGTHRNKKGARSPMASGRLPEIDASRRVLQTILGIPELISKGSVPDLTRYKSNSFSHIVVSLPD